MRIDRINHLPYPSVSPVSPLDSRCRWNPKLCAVWQSDPDAGSHRQLIASPALRAAFHRAELPCALPSPSRDTFEDIIWISLSYYCSIGTMPLRLRSGVH